MNRFVWLSVGFTLLAPALVSAQATPTGSDPNSPRPAPVTPSTAVPAPLAPSDASTTAASQTASAAEGSAASASSEESLLIDDPMMAPVPPPTRVLKDWREALELVRTRSTDYIRAQAQVDAARGRSRMALAAALPDLRGNANINYHLLTEESTNFLTGTTQTLPDPQENWNVGATLRVPVLSSRNWYNHGTSKDAIKQAEISRENVERLIIGALAETIVLVITNERLAEVTRVNLAAALSTLDLNGRRARLGAGSAVDVLRSKQEVARSRAQVVQADEFLRQAREALGEALGYTEPFGIRPDLKLDQLRQDARETCTRGTNADDRADVRAALAGAAIAERNVSSVMYAHVPTIDFLSTVNRTSLDTQNFPQTTWTIGAALTWHLYDGGLRYGEKMTNEALAEQSRQDAISAARKARLEATQATRGVLVARSSLEIAEESRTVAQDNANLARAKFMNGSGTSFDMVDTQSTARETDIEVTVKEFQLLQAEITAFLALASCDL